MKKAQLLHLIADVANAANADLVDPATGEFKNLAKDLKDDAAFIEAVEAAYLADGGTIDDNVKKVIAGLVAILEIEG